MGIVWSGYQRTIGRVFWALLVLAPCSWSQLKLGDNTLSATGLAGVGYTDTMQSNAPDANSVLVTLSGNVNGSYHDPRFLNYTISPYLNQSNLNSNFTSTTSTSGVNAVTNFFSASKTPMQLSYDYIHDAEGSFNVPGQIGTYKTVGNGQDIGFSAAYLPDYWPSIQGSITHGSSDSQVIGQTATGTASTTLFTLGSSYNIWETQLHGSYSKAWIDTNLPLFGTENQFLRTNVNQGTWQFSGSRPVLDNGSFAVNYAHTSVDDNYADSILKTSFNTVSATYNVNPTKKLSIAAHMAYSSDLSAQYLSNVISSPSGASGGAPAARTANSTATSSDSNNQNPYLNFTSTYLNYGATASYHITNGWWVNGLVSRIDQGLQYSNADVSSTDTGVGTVYSHNFFGGTFSASYAINYFWTPYLATASGVTNSHTQTVFGQNASASYGHELFGWHVTGSGNYGRGLTTVLVGYVQDSYALTGSMARNWNSWNINLAATYFSSRLENVTISDNSAASYSLALGRRHWGLSGSYSRSSGSGFQVGNSIIPVPPVTGEPGPIPPLLMLFQGEAWGVGGSWQPIKRTTIYGSYSRSRYNSTSTATGATTSYSDQGYVRAQYFWRQLIFNAGYSYLQQAVGQQALVGPLIPTKLQTVFFGISRRFDFF
jgi:hypothetical protein